MIDAAEKEAMAKILRAMSSFDPEAMAAEAPSAPQSLAESAVAPPAMSAYGTPDAAMKEILTRFHEATAPEMEQSVVRLSESAQTVPELRSALMTEATPTGARIGSWQIVVNESDKRKFYDITHIPSGDVIASDLALYEAARAIANLLNEGKAINSKDARAVLEAEANYSRNLEDAIRFKHSGAVAERQQDYKRKSIMEARYDDAKLRALQAKRLIERML